MDVDTGVVGETEVVPVHPGVTYDTEVVGEAEILPAAEVVSVVVTESGNATLDQETVQKAEAATTDKYNFAVGTTRRRRRALPYSALVGQHVQVEFDGELWGAWVEAKGTDEAKARVRFSDGTTEDLLVGARARVRAPEAQAQLWDDWVREVRDAPHGGGEAGNAGRGGPRGMDMGGRHGGQAWGAGMQDLGVPMCRCGGSQAETIGGLGAAPVPVPRCRQCPALSCPSLLLAPNDLCLDIPQCIPLHAPIPLSPAPP